MIVPEIDIDTTWGPPDALALLDACDDVLPAALVRLATLHRFGVARINRSLAAAKDAGLFRRRRLRRVRRAALALQRRETDRRIALLIDVAAAHGLIGGNACR